MSNPATPAKPRLWRWIIIALILSLIAGWYFWPKRSSPGQENGQLVGFKIAGVAVGNPDKLEKTLRTGGPLCYAIHLGTFQQELLAAGYRFDGIVGFPRTAASLLGMMSGQAELATTGDSPAVLSRARGDKHRALFVTSPHMLESSFWVVGRKSGAKKLEDLGGQRVGLLFGSTFDYAFQTAAQGLQLKDIQYSQLPGSAALPALQNNQLDAYVTSASIGKLWVDQYDLTLVGKLGDVPASGKIVSVITAREDFLAAHPSFAAAFWRGIKTGIDAIKSDPQAYYNWISDSTGYTLENVRTTTGINYEDRPISEDGVEALKKLLAFRLENQVAQASFSVDDWVLRQ